MHKSQNSEALEAPNRAVNGRRVYRPVVIDFHHFDEYGSRIRIRIEVKSWFPDPQPSFLILRQQNDADNEKTGLNIGICQKIYHLNTRRVD
jgi:hypothetical protein